MQRIEWSERAVRRDKAVRIDSLFRRIGETRPKAIVPGARGAQRSTTMAVAIDSVCARAEQGAMIDSWLNSLWYTLDGEAHEDGACALLAAACSVQRKR